MYKFKVTLLDCHEPGLCSSRKRPSTRGIITKGLTQKFLFALIFLFVGSLTPLYAEEVPGLNIPIHTFHPKVSPATAAKPVPAQEGVKSESGLSAEAMQQMNALALEKGSRTSAQKKISSRLLQTIRMLQGKPVANGVPTLETDVELDDSDNLYVDITADVSDELLTRLESAGVKIVYSYPQYHSIRALVPASQMENIAGWDEIHFISPRRTGVTNGTGRGASGAASLRRMFSTLGLTHLLAFTLPLSANPSAQLNAICAGQGSVVSEGDKTHKADLARSTFGICGDGVKVGVLSDGVAHLATSQASGDLPLVVTVLSGQTGSGDEGTAMLEVVHDLAPNASLYFATASNGFASFAKNIRDLQTAGCQIIVDDMSYFAGTPFQDGQATSIISNTNGGLVIQAVNDVVAAGALYFSAAANSGNLNSGTSGTWEGDFVDNGSGRHLFDASTAYDPITYGYSLPITLQWSDPLGGSNNDYDLYVYDSTGTTLKAISDDSQNGSQDPFEEVGASANVTGYRIVIAKFSGAARFLHLAAIRGRLQYATSGAISGHCGSRHSLSMAATPAHLAFGWSGSPTGPYPNPFNSTNKVELFSSDGPRHIFFEANGTAITPGNFSSTGGTVLLKPDFTAADGTADTGAGGFSNPFYGTSCAAPHAAAIAALVKSFNTGLSNATITSALTSTAIDIMASGWDRDSGHGILMPYEAIQSLGPVGTPPTVTAITPAKDSTGVPKTSAVTATFSEPMDSATINTTTFSLNHGATGTVNYNTATYTATFTPSADFSPFTQYTATIATGVHDATGTPIATAYSWDFTTNDTMSPVRIPGPPEAFFDTIGAACAALTGSGTIQAMEHEFTENLLLNTGYALILEGGYDATYSANPNYSTLHGTLTVQSGPLTVERLVIR